MKSRLFTLNLRDLGRSLVVIIGASLITGIYALVQKESLFHITPEEWMNVVDNSITACFAYLVKQLVQNNNGQVLKKDTLCEEQS